MILQFWTQVLVQDLVGNVAKLTRYQFPFSCFALPESFPAVPRASGTVFFFCAQGLVSRGTEGVGTRFHVLLARTQFQRYRGRRVPFSRFARPDTFSAVPKASGLIFMFCAPELIFGGDECVGSRFHVLSSRTRFRQYRERRVPFSCFVLPDSFFGGTEGDESRFHALRARTCFRRYRWRWVLFSSFARPNSFLAVSRVSGPFFKFCSPGLVFVGTEGVGSRLNVLRSQARFRRCRVRRVLFSCLVFPGSFLAVSSASGPVFMFCSPGLVFSGAECVGSLFHVLCSMPSVPWKMSTGA
jgi:hypothetical protein